MTTHNHDVLMAVNSRIINGRKALVKAMDEIIKLRKALAEQPEQPQQEPYIVPNLSTLKHSDNCRYWDDGEYCTCGEAEYHELQYWKAKALAQPAQQEPVAWIRWEWNRSGLRSLTFSKPDEMPLAEEATGVVYDPLYTSSPAQQETVAGKGKELSEQLKLCARNVAFVASGRVDMSSAAMQEMFALIDHVCVGIDSPPAQRKPPTDEQIDAAVKAWFETGIVAGRRPFAKRMRAAIEAAHDIKEQPAQQCTGCEGNPSPQNNPCAVCGKPAQRKPLTIKQEQKAFEKWWIKEIGDKDDLGSSNVPKFTPTFYAITRVEYAWQAWQARAIEAAIAKAENT